MLDLKKLFSKNIEVKQENIDSEFHQKVTKEQIKKNKTAVANRMKLEYYWRKNDLLLW